jgi:hypothetical protein
MLPYMGVKGNHINTSLNVVACVLYAVRSGETNTQRRAFKVICKDITLL